MPVTETLSVRSRPWDNPWFWISGLGLVFVVVVLRNAWAGDDAYITFRSSFHLLHGYGPVFNIDERVQTFTNPLWMLVMSFFYAFTGEAYFTSILLGTGISLIAFWIFGRKILTGSGFLGILILFFLSKSFVEYSTSGLENSLNHLLLVLFAAVFLGDRADEKSVFLLALIAGLGVFNRMDTLLLYLPALLFAWWQVRSWKSLLAGLAGFLPFIFWEGFALIYYGFPFPNTAYAKLNTDISALDLARQGFWYYANSLRWDPVTLLVIFLGLILGLKSGRKSLALALGLLLYLLYVLKIGGDFMSGRFFSAPFMLGMILLGLHFPVGKVKWIPFGILALAGLLNPRSPLYVRAVPDPPRKGLIDPHGVADERGWYLKEAALLYLNDEMLALKSERQLDEAPMGKTIREVKYYDTMGFSSYSKGPQAHVADLWALSSALISRLPMMEDPDWRIGHFTRIMPDGFLETLATDENKLSDQNLAEFYEHLKVITRGPIWSGVRLKEIVKMNLGRYNHLINQEYYRNPGPMFVKLEDLQVPKKKGDAFLSPGSVRIWRYRPLHIQMPGVVHFAFFSIALDNNDIYTLKFLKEGEKLFKMEILPEISPLGGLNVFDISLPPDLVEGGYDELLLEGRQGDSWYSVGHLIPLENLPQDTLP
ncbi:MAG: hypothetical protein H6581_21035 [Bacteroidia bacterium]|nr:hypothetical protein [Bacteroidia bacterium]